MKDSATAMCPVCGACLTEINPRHAGFFADTFFSILACIYCDAQFAQPREVRSDAYEEIYRRAQDIPGYARYLYYRNRIASQDDPLSFLAAREPIYWFVRNFLIENDPHRKWQVLEIGSGLGYLTYSMTEAGWNAIGIDISARAVAEAGSHFGSLYQKVDALVLAEQMPAAFDTVVMTEVIEHLDDMHPMLFAIRKLLKADGVALITTPNKSYHPPTAYWRTDGPPVHLSWLSEKTMERLAARCGFEVCFQDFSRYNLGEPYRSGPAPRPPMLRTYHTFEPDGSVRPELRAAAHETLMHGDHIRAMAKQSQAAVPWYRRVRRQARALFPDVLRICHCKPMTTRFGEEALFSKRGAQGDIWRAHVLGAIMSRKGS